MNCARPVTLLSLSFLTPVAVYQIKLGTLENEQVSDTEWRWHPYTNTAKKRRYLSIESGEASRPPQAALEPSECLLGLPDRVPAAVVSWGVIGNLFGQTLNATTGLTTGQKGAATRGKPAFNCRSLPLIGQGFALKSGPKNAHVVDFVQLKQ
eukprot:g40237.t1